MRLVLSILKGIIQKTIFTLIFLFYSKFARVGYDVTFVNSRNSEINGNIKFVYDEFMMKNTGLKLNVLTLQSKKKFAIQICKIIATSKIVVIDDFILPVYYIPKKLQKGKILQLWHAVGNYKNVGRLRLGKHQGASYYFDKIFKLHSNYDIMFVGSDIEKKMYEKSFYIKEEQIVITGIPKTDIYYNISQIEMKKKLNLCNSKKIAIYAPTHRGKSERDAELIISFLEKTSEESFSWYVSLHPYMENNPQIYEYINSNKKIGIVKGNNIESYLIAADILVSDYSAIILEFVAMLKPVFLHVPDYEAYNKSVGFNHDYVKEFQDAIILEPNEIFEKFLKYDYSKLEAIRDSVYIFKDGQSTKRVVEYIQKIECS